MKLPIEKLNEVRSRTGLGILDCKRVLEQVDFDVERAVEVLRQQGLAKAERKFTRPTAEGLIDAYIHPGARLGVLIEVACETDFVARTEEFKQFVHELALHIAACDPLAISREDLSKEIVERERSIYETQVIKSGKPAQVADRIVSGKLEKFYVQVCLLEQPFVKAPEKTVGEYLKEQIVRFGENIRIKRFARFKIGE
jgi:elongation factor Ts